MTSQLNALRRSGRLIVKVATPSATSWSSSSPDMAAPYPPMRPRREGAGQAWGAVARRPVPDGIAAWRLGAAR